MAAAVVGLVAASEGIRVVQDAAEQRTLAAFYEQPRAAAGDPGALVKSVELAGTPFASRA
ncbi:hypothetical protein AB1K54_09760 [Microbacterium sp. BWT-B31]|uniref:hypothetical protein n=1 Tax=Microbacterium sp. BWT-B31 TaxID=3232072 RepID=UPI003528916F